MVEQECSEERMDAAEDEEGVKFRRWRGGNGRENRKFSPLPALRERGWG
jgi:hypothetical protein